MGTYAPPGMTLSGPVLVHEVDELPLLRYPELQIRLSAGEWHRVNEAMRTKDESQVRRVMFEILAEHAASFVAMRPIQRCPERRDLGVEAGVQCDLNKGHEGEHEVKW